MPGQSTDNLFRSLQKGELAPVYYFYGAEDVLKDEAVRMILDKALDPSLRDFNFDQRSAAQLDAEDVHALCNTLPMLAERRVVLLRDIEGWKRKTKGRSEFLRYLERPSPDTIVIMVQSSSEEAEDKELAEERCRFDSIPCRPNEPGSGFCAKPAGWGSIWTSEAAAAPGSLYRRRPRARSPRS